MCFHTFVEDLIRESKWYTQVLSPVIIVLRKKDTDYFEALVLIHKISEFLFAFVL